MRYGSIVGLKYEVPQSRLYCLCSNVALCSTALQCICRVIRRSSMTMKAHTYYIIFGRPPIGGSFPPWRRHCPGGIAGLPKVSIPNQGTGETSPGLQSLITCREINVQKTDHHSLPTSRMKHDGHSVSTLAVTDLLTRLRLHCHITMITMQLGQTQAGLSNRSLEPVESIGCHSIYLSFRECFRFQPYDCVTIHLVK